MTLAAYVHDIDPFAIRISGEFGIRWYGLSYVAGFVGGYLLLRSLAKQGRILLKPQEVIDYTFALVAGTMIGGRLGYCIFYQPELLIDFSADFPFWGVLALWQGGMASHGGIIGLVAAAVIFAHRHKIPSLHLFDLIALTGPVGICLGRIANFINGELVGRPCDPAFRLAVKFPQDMLDWKEDRVAELARAVAPAGIPYETPSRLVHATIEAIQQGNDQVIAAVEPLLIARHPSQLYAAALEGMFLFVVLWAIWMRKRKPGVIGGWFLVLYPMVRIIDEHFRMPDSGIGFQWLGLTRGQWLSVLMLGIGIGCLVYWSRRKAERIGGWLSPIASPTVNSNPQPQERPHAT